MFQVFYKTGEFIIYRFNDMLYYGRILAFVQIEENGYLRIKTQKLLENVELPRLFRFAYRRPDQL